MKNFIFTSLLTTLLLVVLVPAASASSIGTSPLLSNPDKLAEIATAFGISTETLTTELEEGNTLKQIAMEYKVPKETASTYIKNHFKRLTDDQLQQIATELNITTDEVKAALKDKTLKTLFDAQGTDIKIFMESIGAPKPKHKQ